MNGRLPAALYSDFANSALAQFLDLPWLKQADIILITTNQENITRRVNTHSKRDTTFDYIAIPYQEKKIIEWYSPTIFVVVIYLDPFTSLLEWSNQFRTSNTACGFFFCSCLLMLELTSSRAHASGIPYRK